MNDKFTERAQNALNEALEAARSMGHPYVGTEHILMGLLADSESVAGKVLAKYEVESDDVRELIEKNSGTGEELSEVPREMTPRTKRIIAAAAYESTNAGHSFIGTEHLLLAITVEHECFAAQILSALGVSLRNLRNDVAAYFGADEGGSASASSSSGAKKRSSSGKTPALDAHGRNLCQMARDGKLDPVIGRDRETERVIQILSRRTKNNPCLIGEPGVGKTAVVEGLARRIVDGDVPETLREREIFTLDVSSMIAGSKYRGEFEERMKNVMKEVRENPEVILFIDEIHNIIGAGGAEGAMDAANILKPALSRGEIQIIGATTIDEYRRHIEKDAALERRFQSVTVGEPTPEDAVLILHGLRDKYEAHHKLKITDEAIDAAVKLSVRYIGDRFLPDKAIDLIDEAASKVRIDSFTPTPDVRDVEERLKAVQREKEEAVVGEDFEKAANARDEEKRLIAELDEKRGKSGADRGDLVVTADDIAEVVTSWTGVPVKKLAEEEGERLRDLDKILKSRLIGQDEAVEAVSRAIRRGRMGLKDPKRPIGSFMFLGPTGVGKTELTKALADVMFGDENAMIRVDMSEYMEKHSVSKLIGSPPGYVGYDDGGQLTEKIRRKPYSIVLFDEIEKAHPDVFNILLQILEDGRLTDSQGRIVDFKNTVVIMTSNVGAAGITQGAKRLGFTTQDDTRNENERIRQAVNESLKTTFKPEFLNRLDDIIIFNKLGDEDIRKIAALMLKEVERRVNALDIRIEFTPEAVALLAKEGFDPLYGARPLRRSIVRRVEDPFSEEMLAGKIAAGDDVICDAIEGKIVFYKRGEKPQVEEPAGEEAPKEAALNDEAIASKDTIGEPLAAGDQPDSEVKSETGES